MTNTPDVLTDDVADVAVALVMMTGRGFVRLNRFVQAGEWLKRGPELTTKLAGRTVGILGLGRIGKAIAQRVSAMGMNVAYTGRKPQDVPYRFVPDLEALAAASDFLVVACPGGAATKNIVDAGVLAALGKKGTLVNIARGSIVDEPALVAALQTARSRLRASTCSPTSPTSRSRCCAMDNVVLLPHVGSATRETRQAMGDLCKANLDAWFAKQAAADADPRARLTAGPPSAAASVATRGAAFRRPAPTSGATRGAAFRRPRLHQLSGAIGAGVALGVHSTAIIAATTSASALHSNDPRALAQQQHAGEHADDRHRQRRHRRHRDRQRARQRVDHAQCASVPARKML